MKTKLVLSLAASVTLIGVPLYAQHSHGGAAGGGAMGGHTMSSQTESGSHSGSSQSSVSTRLADNTKLAGKLQSLLPAGTDLQQASQGFKNLGQFVAAVHVSHNLGIPFDQLKAAMIGPPSESLGKAIQQLKPDANAKSEVKKANQQANQDVNEQS